jgi:hypothetical protein
VSGFLEQLLDKSQEEGQAEKTNFEKFKCYCDDNIDAKSSELEKATESIAKLGNSLDGLLAANSELSTQCSKLKTDLASNEAAKREAQKIHSQAKKDFQAEKKDLLAGIGQLKAAMDIFTKVGADQDLTAGADHAKFMAGFKKGKASSLLQASSDVKHTLLTVMALLDSEQRRSFQSFLQAPFTGAYTSQVAGVMGILKNMRDTFKSNLQSSTEDEEAREKEHTDLMKNLNALEKKLQEAYDGKQEELGENDSELARQRLQLTSSKKTKDSAEEFLGRLKPLCEKKAKEFEARTKLRANEEVAISQALGILSSKEFMKSFVQTPKIDHGVGSFLQVSSQRGIAVGDAWSQAQRLLRRFVHQDNRFEKLAQLLQTSNPFAVVLKEIQNMVQVIEKEQSLDKDNHDFCKKETSTGSKDLKETEAEIDKLETSMSKLWSPSKSR